MEKVDLRLFLCGVVAGHLPLQFLADGVETGRLTGQQADVEGPRHILHKRHIRQDPVSGIGRPDLSVGGVGGTADVFHDTADRIGHAVDDNGFADNLGSTVKLLGDAFTDNGLWDGGAEVGFRERFAFQERECVYLPETGIGIVDRIGPEHLLARQRERGKAGGPGTGGLGCLQGIEAFANGFDRHVAAAPTILSLYFGTVFDIEHAVAVYFGHERGQLYLEDQDDNHDHGYRKGRAEYGDQADEAVLTQHVQGLFEVLFEHIVVVCVGAVREPPVRDVILF